MTSQEWAAIQGVAPDATAPVAHPDGRFVQYEGPCPLLAEDKTCSVYAVRPYQCRRFMCLRHDTSEPPIFGGPVGCYNALAAMRTDREALKFYRHNQRRAQVWAVAHGWSPEMTNDDV